NKKMPVRRKHYGLFVCGTFVPVSALYPSDLLQSCVSRQEVQQRISPAGIPLFLRLGGAGVRTAPVGLHCRQLVAGPPGGAGEEPPPVFPVDGSGGKSAGTVCIQVSGICLPEPGGAGTAGAGGGA